MLQRFLVQVLQIRHCRLRHDAVHSGRCRSFEQTFVLLAEITASINNLSITGGCFDKILPRSLSVLVDLMLPWRAKMNAEFAQPFSAAEVDGVLRKLDDAKKVMIMDGKVHQV
mmetsp:Transcript_11323/g.21854  ORF Transcript_11323/g.21854 Transcript_11323/m.21854 type:complete len:113 (+) Transcript_11323:182-520(+)